MLVHHASTAAAAGRDVPRSRGRVSMIALTFETGY
jgi:hypothetical protein